MDRLHDEPLKLNGNGSVLCYEDSKYKSESKKVHLKEVDIIGLGYGAEVDQKQVC